MSDKTKPHRAFEIDIKIGGDTKADAMALLDEFVQSIAEGGTGCAHGGPSAGGSYDVSEHPEMDHERYCRELSEYLAEQ